MNTAFPIRGIVFVVGLLGFAAAWECRAELTTYERMFERTFESRKIYADPFNDVEVDVIFSLQDKSWRVPAFWRGGQQWTVRFAPPVPGEFHYRMESSDKENADLNGERGVVAIRSYTGANALLRHGALRVSSNRRYLEHADGMPFFWLGDTWWMGLSDRLDWGGFQTLAADRKRKGFTVVQILAGLVPIEENPPSDPGFVNEGGQVWEDGFTRINPVYFDHADRRLLHLIDQGLLPAIAGAWGTHLPILGMERMKKHWRYVIARYGAFPVVWIAGGEVEDQMPEAGSPITPKKGGWTQIARYIRAADAHQNPLTVHERFATGDGALLDRTITDFDLLQAGHLGGWRSIPVNIAQVGMHYARSPLVKPVIQGEIGYEKLGEQFFEDFQRAAFWTTVLNGGAGHTYGANGVFEAYTADKPFHRIKWSFLTWQEGMQLPGAYQVGLAANLLRRYRWWMMQPRPDWISPGGTTFFEPRSSIPTEDVSTTRHMIGADSSPNAIADSFEAAYPGGKWQEKKGTYFYPYIAGIPGEFRIAYLPYFGLVRRSAPTIHQLEPGVRYRAYYWEPTTGTRIDLGAVERPKNAEILFSGTPPASSDRRWERVETDLNLPAESTLSGLLLNAVRQKDIVVAADIAEKSSGGVFLRYVDADNFLAALYVAKDSAICLIERNKGQFMQKTGRVSVGITGGTARLRGEVRGSTAAVALDTGTATYSSEIVNVGITELGHTGYISTAGASNQDVRFEVRRSPKVYNAPSSERRLIDAEGKDRGELKGVERGPRLGWIDAKPWDDYARAATILLDSYRPEELPTSGDWVLVLETPAAQISVPRGSHQQQNSQPLDSPTIDADGTVHVLAMRVPLSPLSSEEAKQNFLDFSRGWASFRDAAMKSSAGRKAPDIKEIRRGLDDMLMKPGVERLRRAFAVSIAAEKVGGVQTDVVEPAGGISPKNTNRVLINLHGGGFTAGARYGGQMESIPIASLAAIRVITVDYRLAPEHQFPAASEDVASVYRELLKRYRAENIGIYGCSAGALLTAQSVAWFQQHGLPRPGAVGMFGGGGLARATGDSNYIGVAIGGMGIPVPDPDGPPPVSKYLLAGTDPRDPLVSPAWSPSVLAMFPPSLLVSGTRDIALSSTVFTHSQLINAGVDADLHVWEGAPHCSFAQPVVNPDEPESRQVWEVIVKFFDRHLGRHALSSN